MLVGEANVGDRDLLEREAWPSLGTLHGPPHRGLQSSKPFFGDGGDKCATIGKMPIGRRLTHPGGAGNRAQRQRVGSFVAEQLNRAFDERTPEIPVMVGSVVRRGCAGGRLRSFWWHAGICVDSVNIARYVNNVNIPTTTCSRWCPMPPRSARRIAAFCLLFGTTPTLHAQTTPPSDPELAASDNTLSACLRLVSQQHVAEAQQTAKQADASYTNYLKRHPKSVEAMVGLARAKSQCLLPAAGLMEQGELSSDAIDLLDNALAIEPRHWLARYALATILYRSPAFLGRGTRSAKEYDELLRQQENRSDNPMFARVYEYRGQLFSREHKDDSAAAMWKRGAALFPADSALRALAEHLHKTSSTESTALAAVRVVASASTPPASPTSPQQVTRTQVLMTAGGAADVLQAVQMQPGATRVNEGADIYTRGGDPGETAVIVNGGRLMSISRFEGLSGSMFGAIEPWIVQSVRYSSGGFSARYGNALSGVLEIETDGKPREREYRAGLSLVQASGTARAPFGKKIGGWIDGRAENTRVLLATHGRTDEFQTSPRSEELAASVVAQPTALSEVRATVLIETDDSRRLVNSAGWFGPFHSAAASKSLVLSSRWLSSDVPLTVRSSLVGSKRSSDWAFGVLARMRNEESLNERLDAEWAPAASFTLRTGVEAAALTRRESGALPTTLNVTPGSPVRTLTDDRTSGHHAGGYVETEISHAATSITLGVRSDRLPGEERVTLDPRVAVSTRRGAWIARASGGVFHQGRYRADAAIPDAGQPSGSPTTARHLVAGLEREGVASTVRAELYEKTYSDYAARGVGPQIIRGNARGLDLFAQSKSIDRVTASIAYSLLHADAELVDGRHVRSPLDVTHTATGTTTVSVTRDWSVGTTARYGTGVPLTPIVGGEADATGRVGPVYGAPMSKRMSSYARLDARVMRFVRRPKFLLSTFVEVINLLNRPNASGLTYDATYRSSSPMLSFFATRTIVGGGEFQFR